MDFGWDWRVFLRSLSSAGNALKSSGSASCPPSPYSVLRLKGSRQHGPSRRRVCFLGRLLCAAGTCGRLGPCCPGRRGQDALFRVDAPQPREHWRSPSSVPGLRRQSGARRASLTWGRPPLSPRPEPVPEAGVTRAVAPGRCPPSASRLGGAPAGAVPCSLQGVRPPGPRLLLFMEPPPARGSRVQRAAVAQISRRPRGRRRAQGLPPPPPPAAESAGRLPRATARSDSLRGLGLAREAVRTHAPGSARGHVGDVWCVGEDACSPEAAYK